MGDGPRSLAISASLSFTLMLLGYSVKTSFCECTGSLPARRRLVDVLLDRRRLCSLSMPRKRFSKALRVVESVLDAIRAHDGHSVGRVTDEDGSGEGGPCRVA